MLSLTQPGFLLAGIFLAAIPVVLHFLARRPPDRTPLPTARFLSPDARTHLGLRSRPDHLLLLLLRVALLLLLGLAFARPVWAPERAGTLRIVLLDSGGGMAGAWDNAVAMAVERAREGEAEEGAGMTSLLVLHGGGPGGGPEGAGGSTSGGTSGGEPVLLPGAMLDANRVDSLRAAPPPEGARFLYLEALRTARRISEASPGYDSVEVHLVTRPRHAAWSAGVHPLRPLLWPGRVEIGEVRAVPSEEEPGPLLSIDAGSGEDAAPRAVVHAAEGEGRFVRAALRALGREVVQVEEGAEGAGAGLHVVVGSYSGGTSETALLDLLDRGRTQGDTVILAGVPLVDLPGEALDAIPWIGPAASASAASGEEDGEGIYPTLLLVPDVQPSGRPGTQGASRASDALGAVARPGSPRAGARIPLLHADGRAAAAGDRVGAGCITYLSALPEAGALSQSPLYPEIFEALLRACPTPEPFVRPDASQGGAGEGVQRENGVTLGEDEVALLRADHLPERVAAAYLAQGEASSSGIALLRWLLVAALLFALLETALAYGPEWRTGRRVRTDDPFATRGPGGA